MEQGGELVQEPRLGASLRRVEGRSERPAELENIMSAPAPVSETWGEDAGGGEVPAAARGPVHPDSGTVARLAGR